AFGCLARGRGAAFRGRSAARSNQASPILKMESGHKKTQNLQKLLLCLLWLFVAAFSPQQYGYRVVKSYPHERNAFTQGLEFRDGFLYEGTGLVGRSSLRKVNLETGQVVQRFD